jgi:adenosylcobinamide-phosphate synthase
MWPAPTFLSVALALAVERLAGYPEALQRTAGHPVAWMGWLIGSLDRALNAPGASAAEGRLRGGTALAVLLAATFLPAWLIAVVLARSGVGWIVEPLLATAFIAQHSLGRHVEDVHGALGRSLADGRIAVARIVGRDPAALDEAGVCRAALESLAENTSDGIVAPVFWYVFLGLPGLVVYKAVNTADSMIGHRDERYRHFGWAAARLDDLVNLPASRLSGALFAAAASTLSPARGRPAWRAMWRDAPGHVSPNAGWPEAAFAAGLGLRLGGPRAYDGITVDLAWMGEGRSQPGRDDIRAGLRLYGRALNLLLGLMLAAAVFS